MQKKHFYHAARRIFTGLCLAFAVTSANTDSANADDFTDLQKAAKGQTVYFNAWGGDAKINSYISWAGQTLADRHDITRTELLVQLGRQLLKKSVFMSCRGK